MGEWTAEMAAVAENATAARGGGRAAGLVFFAERRRREGV